MKKFIKQLCLFAILVSTPYANAIETIGSGGVQSPTKPTVANKGANCDPSTGVLRMEFNNVSALLKQGGLLFREAGATGAAAYEVPKGSKVKAIYAGSLWMGGKDVNGQLKLAGITFQNDGHDFWPGPLTVEAGSGTYNPQDPSTDGVIRDFGEANIDPETCRAYDRFYTMRKGEVIRFNLWWACGNIPETEGCETILLTENLPTNDELNRIYGWPAHGDVSKGQDFYLAPFYDRDGDGVYNPDNGDHPWYDDILGRDDIQCGVDRRISLFGDETHWWVFNDKGNIHGETGGEPIGMEIRAQAFAFATNDEVNSMTFYNYELINRSTQTLFETYFSQYLDTDLGNYSDDYVGCDVSRGLGYCYNGDLLDEADGGNQGYGENPPAIGCDFFEGPYQDADFKDNLGPVFDSVTKEYISPSVNDAIADNGIVYRGIGNGYSDGIIDNERFGMRRFTYYTNGAAAAYGDPSNAAQFYNYMSGRWSDGSTPFYGGQGFVGSEGVTETPSDYMFPGDSDPLNWGTAGQELGFDWDETTNNNPAGDRRFVQSAGPFTLKPGAVNNITVGLVYGRGSDGDLLSSVRAVRRADSKAQALFDNCFRILSPPDAPKLIIQELENSLILTIENPQSSNNFNEEYEEEDNINIVDEGVNRFYNFEGYQIFQLKDVETSVSDITDPNKARLVAQCDIINYEEDESGEPNLSKPIDRLINFEFDEALGFAIPVEKVDGENKGIRHSFELLEDQFAQGERALVNHKTYYYIAIAYAFNNYADYDPSDPLKLNGQKTPYIASRLGSDKNAIEPVSAVPHNPRPAAGGTSQLIEYGSTPRITKLDGHGNGGRALKLTAASENTIVANGFMANPEYDFGGGPINVKVVDPLNLADGYFECEFNEFSGENQGDAADTASWTIKRYASKGGQFIESVSSSASIDVDNEQLIPKWGVSVQIYQTKYYFEKGITGNPSRETTDVLSADLTYTDSSKQWMSLIPDVNGFFPLNWIRSGTNDENLTDYDSDDTYSSPICYNDEVLVVSANEKYSYDPDARWSSILNGGFAPHRLVGYQCDFMPLSYFKTNPSYPEAPEGLPGQKRDVAGLAFSPSIDIVLTTDKSKWTRCPVIELGRDKNLNIGGALPGGKRKSTSVNKNGVAESSGTGMGWFPGYAIDIESGARLYMAFGENSFLGNDNGSDMIWNPSSRLFDNVNTPVMAGQHAIYVFSYKSKDVNGYSQLSNLGAYKESNNEVSDLLDLIESGNPSATKTFYTSLTWIGQPFLTPGQTLLSSDARIQIRVNKEYRVFSATGNTSGKPKYSWDMSDIATKTGNESELANALQLINVVPNPYYAFSEYERGRLDNRVKITNLPEECTITIYSINGKLVRTFKKASPITSIDWDLNNKTGIPIASGVYLIHVSVPDVGDVVVKFFAGIREVDLQGL